MSASIYQEDVDGLPTMQSLAYCHCMLIQMAVAHTNGDGSPLQKRSALPRSNSPRWISSIACICC